MSISAMRPFEARRIVIGVFDFAMSCCEISATACTNSIHQAVILVLNASHVSLNPSLSSKFPSRSPGASWPAANLPDVGLTVQRSRSDTAYVLSTPVARGTRSSRCRTLSYAHSPHDNASPALCLSPVRYTLTTPATASYPSCSSLESSASLAMAR